jgi:hypothetical protein
MSSTDTTNTNPAELVPYVQSIFDQFKAIGLTLDINDVPFLIWNSGNAACNGDSLKFNTYCEDRLLALPAYANIIGLGLTRNQTLEMAKLPKFNQIRVAVDLLEVIGNVVSVKHVA